MVGFVWISGRGGRGKDGVGEEEPGQSFGHSFSGSGASAAVGKETPIPTTPIQQ